MRQAIQGRDLELSRRAFLAATGGVLAGAATLGLAGQAEAGQRHPERGGALRFATRSDTSGLDLHRNTIYLVSMPLAAINQGLLDLNQQSEPVPGVAAAWEASQDLLSYTFELRHGVLFHNGREVDAEAVKWNFERIQDPKIAHPLARSALENLKATEVVDKYTVRCHLHQPSAADLHPIGCGPFKFVTWDRNNLTELVRFENYFETDAEGNSLPYLDAIIGRPKREDGLRLTALRTGEVDLIDSMAYADAAEFPKKYAGKFQTWNVPTLATSFILFNLEKGPFSDKQVRLAAAHAI